MTPLPLPLSLACRRRWWSDPPAPAPQPCMQEEVDDIELEAGLGRSNKWLLRSRFFILLLSFYLAIGALVLMVRAWAGLGGSSLRRCSSST